MAKTVTYFYEAKDGDSFIELSKYAIKSSAVVTINPNKQTILATTDKNDGSDDDPILYLGSIINSKALSFHITHVDCDGDILKQIADLTKENKVLANDKKKADEDKKFIQERYDWMCDSIVRIKKQIAAIGTLIEAIGQ